MQLPRFLLVAGLFSAFTFTAPARAETKVELKGVHLCCPNCAKGVAAILTKVDGVKGACDLKQKTVTITAPDDKTAQKALDALAEGGYHGTTSSKSVAIKDDSGVAKGKVKSLTLTGAHNCCGSCCKGIKAAVGKVNGVTSDDAKPKTDTFTVTGDFDAAELVQALNAAGYHVKVKK